MSDTAVITARPPLPHALAGQSVLIIGGSSGIGLAAARLLGDIGAHVTLAGRDPARLAAAARYLEGEAQTRQADATDTPSLQALFEAIGQLDHVFVTAGTLAGGPLASTDVAALRPTLDSHIWSAYEIARLAAPRLRAGGSLTLISNTFGERPLPTLAVAAATMAGVEGMARALALELAPLRVNVVRAANIDTPLARAFYGGADDARVAAIGSGLLLKRVGRAEEAAAAALFCMANGYVTGSVVVVDGGTSLA
jgi:NAD(P)-dependent dehydrogenase (short-subunit alcohol dehydrogenase family)